MTSSVKRLHLLYSAHGVFMLASIMLVPLFAIFATEAGASLLIVSYLGSAYFATKTIGVLMIRYITPTINQAGLCLQCSYLIKALCWLGLIFSNSIILVFAVQAVLGLAEGIQSPAFRTLTAHNLTPGKEMAQYADWEIILALTGIIGTSLGGYIATNYGFNGLFFIMIILSFTALVLSIKVAK